jgi:hypothetical protein
MSLNNYDYDPFDQENFQEELKPEPNKKPANRIFKIILIIHGVVLLEALLALILFAPKYIATQRSAQMEQAALINAANTATAMAGVAQENQQLTAQASTATALVPTTAPTSTPTVIVPTHTPVVAGTGLSVEEMATVSALQTKMAAQGTAVVTPTELPETGFAEDMGLPTMAGIAAFLIIMIIFIRNLRLSAR